MKDKFDYIVYGASIAGCLIAIQKANEDNEVLLINNFGFPGGSISESLNCLQQIESTNCDALNYLVSEIEKDKFGFLYKKMNTVIVNPEIIKYKLQTMLINSSVTPLFHGKPFEIETLVNKKFLSVSLKEGIMKFKYDKLIDASDNYDLFTTLFPHESQNVSTEINCVTTRLKESSLLDFKDIHNTVKLNNGRYWVSFKLGNDSTFKPNGQNILDEFSATLLKSNNRIQLLPSTYFVRHNIIEDSNKSGIITKYHITKKQFKSDELLLEADQILNSNY
ncbi:MAG: hypothetical protein COW71_07805 [Ignavibacteriales bacterium CG18_big_fil_WC_8_21_14_2_50_31_20]|nr:MAG: hypothetical protein COW71_07805 [Ignavibacteriales bacterium CG18_big_fil_WC_8_21_14_2_50_31_20]